MNGAEKNSCIPLEIVFLGKTPCYSLHEGHPSI